MSVTGLPTEARAKSRRAKVGGEAGIRTLGTTFRSYNGLANRRLQPLGHLTLRLAVLAQGEPQTLSVREFSTCVIEILHTSTRPARGRDATLVAFVTPGGFV